MPCRDHRASRPKIQPCPGSGAMPARWVAVHLPAAARPALLALSEACDSAGLGACAVHSPVPPQVHIWPQLQPGGTAPSPSQARRTGCWCTSWRRQTRGAAGGLSAVHHFHFFFDLEDKALDFNRGRSVKKPEVFLCDTEGLVPLEANAFPLSLHTQSTFIHISPLMSSHSWEVTSCSTLPPQPSV